MEKVPFLPYGMANEGPADMWKTHNVLASTAEVILRKLIIESTSIVFIISYYSNNIREKITRF